MKNITDCGRAAQNAKPEQPAAEFRAASEKRVPELVERSIAIRAIRDSSLNPNCLSVEFATLTVKDSNNKKYKEEIELKKKIGYILKEKHHVEWPAEDRLKNIIYINWNEIGSPSLEETLKNLEERELPDNILISGVTPLSIAIGGEGLGKYKEHWGEEEEIREILNRGALHDFPSGYLYFPFPPLVGALRKGMAETAILLLDYGANPNSLSDPGHGTPGMIYAASWHSEWAPELRLRILEKFVEKGALIDLRGSSLASPLCEASRNGILESVEYLLKAGANPFLVSKAGTARQLAKTSKISYLLKEAEDRILNAMPAEAREAIFKLGEAICRGLVGENVLGQHFGDKSLVIKHEGNTTIFVLVDREISSTNLKYIFAYDPNSKKQYLAAESADDKGIKMHGDLELRLNYPPFGVPTSEEKSIYADDCTGFGGGGWIELSDGDARVYGKSGSFGMGDHDLARKLLDLVLPYLKG